MSYLLYLILTINSLSWLIIWFLIQLHSQQVLKFIQNTVNPIGYEVDEIGKVGDEGDFDDGYEQNIEYVIDSDDYKLFWYIIFVIKFCQ